MTSSAKMPCPHADPEGPVLPVLYIPGNAGTHQQVNALAAETARQWDRAVRGGLGVPDLMARKRHVNLDWYSIDTREQWSAFHGDLLVRT